MIPQSLKGFIPELDVQVSNTSVRMTLDFQVAASKPTSRFASAWAWCINKQPDAVHVSKAEAAVRTCSAREAGCLELTLSPVVSQACGVKVHTVNFAQDSVHGSVYGPPLVSLQSWQRRVFVDKAWAVFHQIEGRANDPGRDTDRVFQ